MSDLISRSKLIEEIKNDLALKYTGDVTVNFINGMIARQNEIVDIINNQPTVEAVPVVHGEWIDEFGKFLLLYKCSECSSEYPWNTNFCPNCGCDMRTSAE